MGVRTMYRNPKKPPAGVTARWESKYPHTTRTLVIEHPAGQPPKALLEGLASVQFKQWFANIPPLDGVQQVYLDRRGNGLFGGWALSEAAAFMADARTWLRAYGITRVPYKRRSAQELI